MKEMKRILAMVLCFVMLVGLLPNIAFAAEGDPVVVIAGSDFQNSSGDTAGGNTVTSIIKQMGYSSVDGVLFGGDYSWSMSSNSTNLSNLDGYLDDYCATAANRIYIQGNHDTSNNSSLLAETGSKDTNDYGVYVINYSDFGSAASGLESYLDGKSGSEPIFVLSHQPLHVTSRGDNTKAVNLFNVLNNYEDLNIIFLFGHNHSGGYDAYLGNGAIYLPKGSSITVAGGSTETLNFTYMNYGYVGYVSGSSDTALTMTAFEIYEDEVYVKRYDEDGLHNLKAAGATVSGYNTDSNVYGTAVIDLSDGTSTISAIGTDSGSGDSGTTGGSGTVYKLDTDGVTTGEDYLIVSAGADGTAQALRNNNGSVSSAEVTISNGKIVTDATDIVWTYDDSKYLSNDGQYIYLTYNNSISFDANEPRAMAITSNNAGEGAYTVKRDGDSYNYYLNYSNTSWTCGGSADDIYFFVRTSETGSGGGSTVTPEGGDWVIITEPVEGSSRYQYELDTDGVDTGVEYLIVAESYEKALSAAASSNNSVDIEIEGNYAYADADTYGWTFTSYSNGVYYIRLNGSTYLGYNNGLTSANSLPSNNQNRYRWNVASSGDGIYTVRSNRDNSYYLRWSNSNGVFQASSSNRNPVRLYKYVGEENIQAQNGLFAKITGNLEYNVERGLTAEQVLDLVKAEIKGYEYTGTAAPGDDVEGTEITENLEFVLDPSYDGAKAGQYAVTIKYKGVTLGTAKVIVPEVAITGYDCQDLGSVKVGASGKTRTGANITVNLEDGTSYTVPVTLDMLSGEFTTEEADTYTGLTVTYNGVVVCEDFTLNVREPSPYPEYPDEGSVAVNKTGTGIQFQSTGVAQIEVSASGIPMNQGVDVLLVLDTSSSMEEAGSLTSGTRIAVLQECVNALIQNLKAERADGSVPDVHISIVDFAGYLEYKSVNYIESQAKSTTTAQLGAVLLDWTDVQNVSNTWGNGLSTKSGTNYDHGLLMGYEQLSKKQEQDNGSRKQFVLFMSDGAPFQYNGIGSSETGEGNEFEKWLLGTYTQEDVEGINTIQNPEFYYESEGGAQKNRIAEAIKGTGTFKIPSYTETGREWTGELVEVPGLGATMYSVGYALEEDYSRNPTGLDGMNAILKTIASVSEDTGEKLFYPVESKEDLEDCFDDFAGEVLMAATSARFVDQMGAQYKLQMGTIKDLNGDAIGVENKIEILSYEIWTRADYLAGKVTADKIGDRKGTYSVLETITFNADGSEVYSDKNSVGPNGETITAGENILIDGVIYAQNFWYNNNSYAVEIDGVDIPTGADANGLTTGSTNMLPAETFYWKVGTIKTTELAMRYFVYLEGSMEGTCEPGSYPTNEYAILYYNNYLNQPTGQPCQKPTFSPVMAWDAANVSYAFYLVDENGNIIVNQTTGETGSFANKIAVTNPVVYKEVLLNNTGNVESIEVASLGVLPDGYQLYDEAAVYTIQIKSDATGSWTIAKGDNKAATTYVTQFDLNNSAAYSNELTKNSGADFTHTVVWFAVVWKVQALPDTVVIDYGLPVDISVLSNDMFGENGKLAGVGAVDAEGVTLDGYTTDNKLPNTSYTAEYGTAEADASTGKVRYTPGNMQMNGYDEFAYAVNYTGSKNAGYYYDTVTVIPATTIYYEDEFVTLATSVKGDDGNYTTTPGWDTNSVDATVTQDEDRPGKYSLTDANNIYGFDSHYTNFATHSLDNAAMVHVEAGKYATAEFDFFGTGFDVISMTSNTTGTLTVKVTAAAEIKDADGNVVYAADATVKNMVVDTYYGYTSEMHKIVYTYTDGQWVSEDQGVTTETQSESKPAEPKEGDSYTVIKQVWLEAPDVENSLYQVPIIKLGDLPYGKYHVVITASYVAFFDHTAPAGYDLYLDAIRIYDPANDGASDGSEDTTIEDAYVADGEGWPTYVELRNKILEKGTFADNTTTTQVEGLVFIDGDASVGNAQIADYASFGPNNEVYLAPNQRIAFIVNYPSNLANVHIGIKSADSQPATYTIANIARNSNDETGVEAGDYYGEKTYTVNTSTDMYYDLTGWAYRKGLLESDIIVISNTGTGIISLTNIKFTYTSDPNGNVAQGIMTLSTEDEVVETPVTTAYVYMTAPAATLTLRSMNTPVVDETPEETEPETTVPEETEPETTVPEETEPETTVPEETEPETTVPEETEPETTVPEETEPSVEEVVETIVKEIIKRISRWFGKWF